VAQGCRLAPDLELAEMLLGQRGEIAQRLRILGGERVRLAIDNAERAEGVAVARAQALAGKGSPTAHREAETAKAHRG